MTPWPTVDVLDQQSDSAFGQQPHQMTAPNQQPPDVFATYNNNNNNNNNNGQQQQQQAPLVQQQQVQQQPVVQQQQYQQQVAMALAPMMQAPMQAAPPQPMMMQVPQMQMPAQQQPVVQQPPAPQQQQPPQEQQTPPPAVVVTNNAIGNDSPVSQLGDVSVIAASANINTSGPAMPNATTPSQPLQPFPQSMSMQHQPVVAAPQMPVSQPPVQQQPAVVAANPFDSFLAIASTLPTPAPTTTQPPVALAPPPAMAPPQAPPSPPVDNTQPANIQQVQQVVQQTLSPPMSPVVALAPQQQAYADPFGFTFSPLTSPVTSPGGSPNGSPGAMVQSTSVNSDPFGVFGGNNKPPTPPQMTNNATVSASADPFASGALVPSAQAPPVAPVATGTVNDPFGIFGNGQPAQPATAQPEPNQTGHMFSPPAPAPQEAEDPWAAAGFGQSNASQPEATSQPSPDAAPAYNQQNTSLTGGKQEDKPITLDSNNLPSEGEYYEARINARSLGAMFFTARNLEETLFTKLANNIIEALGSRPVVSYVAEGSAANNAGVHLGHVILSVNGQDIQDPEQCANVIRNAPRPMNIRCYIPPDLELTLHEGRHLVKYDTKGATAPASGVEWKRKYVVMGGIVSKPYMMNMFYRKKDYDTAVKEAHAGRKISVKVKQFDLRGARIVLQNKDGKPNYVNYQTERVGWHYITILPYKGYPIKISSESLEDLEPVYSAVRRFIRKDMDNAYQSRMQQSFGGGSGLGGGAPSRGRSMSPSRTESAGARHFNERGSSGKGRFEGFEDDPNATGQGSYWNNTQYVKGANKY